MKQVFLIGDSIRMGYCEAVKEALSDRAEVIYPPENCRSSQYILMRLLAWSTLCQREDVAVVHINCGQWDVSHLNFDPEPLTSLEEYEKKLRSIVWVLKSFFPNAQIVLATTTPMNPQNPETCNPRTTADIMRYNDVIMKIAQEQGIPVNDLFAVSQEWGADLFLDYCHLTEEGYQRLAHKVTETVLRYI